MSRVAVIGAAGYVGLAAVDELLRRGHEVVAVVRDNGRMLLRDRKVQVASPDDAASIAPPSVVVNLAYPTSGSNLTFRAQNRALAVLIRSLARSSARVIHISTEAVFGFELEHVPRPAPVAPRLDDAYIVVKIELERMLMADSPGASLDIVRLGNVWGPASPTWTAALADRLLFGLPVGVSGRDGYSNVTDVGNVASYIAHLAEARIIGSGPQFHHLAELGAVRWSFWVDRMAAALGVSPMRANAVPSAPTSAVDEVRDALAVASPVNVLRELYFQRRSGAFLRSVVSKMPAGVANRVKKLRSRTELPNSMGPADIVFLTVLACPRQFESVVQPDWRAPISVDESCARVRAWLTRAGYVLAPGGERAAYDESPGRSVSPPNSREGRR